MHKLGLLLGVALLALSGASGAANEPLLWKDIRAASIVPVGERLIVPTRARSFSIDYGALRDQLARAPAEGSGRPSTTVVSLPMPDGGSARFRLVETAVMAPGLAAKFPSIRTYAGVKLDDPRITGRFDIGPRGLHGMIFSPQGRVFIDPYSRGDTTHYLSYFKHDLPRRAGLPGDRVIAEPERVAELKTKAATRARANKGVTIAGDLRTYRLAMAADYEYSSFHDPSSPIPDKAIVLAELVNVVNRVTAVYERELGIRLQLVDGNEAIIFNTPVQPYIDSQGIAMLAINTLVIDALIGSANYDIGHVTSTGGGGVAGLGVVCSASSKGQGVTGLPNPVGDPYYIDYVAHEMGHQFGANHTFNSETGSCGGGNRNASTAYEPGSGVTIMGYAGICAEDNIAPNSIDTFHAASFDEIVAYTRDDAGNDCAAISTTRNRAPLADAGIGGFSIPKLTPFELTGSGSDADGDPLTYQWEQFDLGAAGLAEAPDATAPLFRSFLPTSSPTRSFPQTSDLLANSRTLGERLPDRARDLNFRLTVRDNRVASSGGGTADLPEAGGVSSADLSFKVADVGPFQLSAPNGGGSFKTGVPFTAAWDVAGTDLPPVSCAAVNLLLSVDGGLSFPYTLAAAVANDGGQEISLPAGTASDSARLKVKCASSVFFDISDDNFTIVAGPAPPVTPPVTPPGPVPVEAAEGRFGGSLSLLASLALGGLGLLRRRRVRR